MKGSSLKAGRPSRDIPPKTLATLRGEGETARLNADIPLSLYEQVKHRATDENTSIAALTIKALTEYLSK
jgi:hypothetical protein